MEILFSVEGEDRRQVTYQKVSDMYFVISVVDNDDTVGRNPSMHELAYNVLFFLMNWKQNFYVKINELHFEYPWSLRYSNPFEGRL